MLRATPLAAVLTVLVMAVIGGSGLSQGYSAVPGRTIATHTGPMPALAVTKANAARPVSAEAPVVGNEIWLGPVGPPLDGTETLLSDRRPDHATAAPHN